MLIRLDPASAVPLFEQIATAVRGEVVRGAARPGDRLPSAKDLAESLDVNLHTVLKAYQELQREGVLELRRGRGATITPAAAAYVELGREIPRLVDRAKALGIRPAVLAALIKEQ